MQPKCPATLRAEAHQRSIKTAATGKGGKGGTVIMRGGSGGGKGGTVSTRGKGGTVSSRGNSGGGTVIMRGTSSIKKQAAAKKKEEEPKQVEQPSFLPPVEQQAAVVLPALSLAGIVGVTQVEELEEMAATVAGVAAEAAASLPSVTSLVSGYPVLTGVGAAVVAVGGIAMAVLRGAGRGVAETSATNAFEALVSEERTLLLDIRPKASQKAEGVFDLRDAGKRVAYVEYGEFDEEGRLLVKEDFVQQFKDLEMLQLDTIVIVVDTDGKVAPKAAKAIASSKYLQEKVYYVKGGMEGPKGWKESELPWKPYRALQLSLPNVQLPDVQLPNVNLTEAVGAVNDTITTIKDVYNRNPTLVNGILAAAGIAAVGTFAVMEFELLLNIVGILGLARFAVGNLLFADDREKTLATLRKFLNERAGVRLAEAGASSASAPASASAAPALPKQLAAQQQLEQLTQIVNEAKDAKDAAQLISNQLLPDIKGVDPDALAAALKASAVDLSAFSVPAEPKPAATVAPSAPTTPEPQPKPQVVAASAPPAQVAVDVPKQQPEAAAAPAPPKQQAVAAAAPAPPKKKAAKKGFGNVAPATPKQDLTPAPAPAAVISEAVAAVAPKPPAVLPSRPAEPPAVVPAVAVAAAASSASSVGPLPADAAASTSTSASAHASEDDVPPNVAEARVWINNWISKQQDDKKRPKREEMVIRPAAAAAASTPEPAPAAAIIGKDGPVQGAAAAQPAEVKVTVTVAA